MLTELDHPFIIKPIKLRNDIQTKYIVLPYCQNGDLFDIVEKSQGIGESASRKILKQLCSAIGYLHEKGIVH